MIWASVYCYHLFLLFLTLVSEYRVITVVGTATLTGISNFYHFVISFKNSNAAAWQISSKSGISLELPSYDVLRDIPLEDLTLLA